MRYASDHKAGTRVRVVEAAAREIRARGPGGVGVARVMASAGLTHGGFYAHFASKAALVEAALDAMFTDVRGWAGAGAGGQAPREPRAALAAFVRAYLSPAHRDACEQGCPLPALAGDFARGGGAARTRFTTGVAAITERLAHLLARRGEDDPQAAATALLAQLVGAVALARAVDDPARSDAILGAVRATLLARYDLETTA